MTAVALYLVPSSARRNASRCFGCLWSLHTHNTQLFNGSF